MARILLVEDDRFTRELYELLLKEEGYQVDTADNGDTGFFKALEGGYDLVLLDIMLPKKDGLSILRDLKKIPSRQANKKIVMLTVLNQDEFIKSAMKMGADGYLMKQALKPNEILAEVKAFLE